MIALNHALTGAVVAVVLKEPTVALPAAFLSHFAIDSLPHWNYWVPGQKRFRRWVIYSDVILSLAILGILAFFVADTQGWLIITGGLLAVSPDMMWFPYLIIGKNAPANTNSPLHRLRRFHLRIQWSETSAGIFNEALWLVLMLIVFLQVEA